MVIIPLSMQLFCTRFSFCLLRTSFPFSFGAFNYSGVFGVLVLSFYLFYFGLHFAWCYGCSPSYVFFRAKRQLSIQRIFRHLPQQLVAGLDSWGRDPGSRPGWVSVLYSQAKHSNFIVPLSIQGYIWVMVNFELNEMLGIILSWTYTICKGGGRDNGNWNNLRLDGPLGSMPTYF